jgi:hypothetical protein
MPINQANRAAVGSWYIAEIQRRIKVRKEAAERAKAEPDAREKVIRSAGEASAKLHRLGTVLAAAIVDHKRDPVTDEYVSKLQVVSTDGISVRIPLRLLPKLAASLEAIKAPRDLARKACEEASFLTGMLGNAAIAGFQSYVSKLHAEPSTMPGPATLGKMLDDYLTSRRPASCAL